MFNCQRLAKSIETGDIHLAYQKENHFSTEKKKKKKKIILKVHTGVYGKVYALAARQRNKSDS